MFNWFRRRKEEPESAKAPAEETPVEPSSSPAEAPPAPAPDDQLAWAKAAYQRMQAAKQQQEQQATPVPESVEAAATASPEVETTAASPADEGAVDGDGPAWLQQSGEGLDRLKATAVEETEVVVSAADATAATEPDSEFVWAANTLAAQGRSLDDVTAEEIDWLKQLRQGLGKTRRSLVNQLKSVVGAGPLNEDALFEIEALLLQADVGLEATDRAVAALQTKIRDESLPPDEAIAYLKQILCEILEKPLRKYGREPLAPLPERLNVWLLVGVNGAGKTTTIGKLAHMAVQSGYQTLIAAADTFRAAAVEQVKVWGERSATTVIANPAQKNTDPAAVVFDALEAARARETDLLLVDTAGRLQNKKNLMEELAKIRRIVDKKAPEAQIESLLVLDATLGQNGLRQAIAFADVANLSGVVLTKLDGTAKGGVALAIAEQLDLPIRFIGVGEGIEDLRPFASFEFVEALLGGDESAAA